MHLFIEELLEDCEAAEPRHLDIEEDNIRPVRANQLDGLDAVRALRQDLNPLGGLEQIEQLLPGEWLVVDDEGGKCHGVMLEHFGG